MLHLHGLTPQQGNSALAFVAEQLHQQMKGVKEHFACSCWGKQESFRLTSAKLRVWISNLPLTGPLPFSLQLLHLNSQCGSCCWSVNGAAVWCFWKLLLLSQSSEIQPRNIVSSLRCLIFVGQKFPDCTTHLIPLPNHVYDDSFFLYVYIMQPETVIGHWIIRDRTSLNCIKLWEMNILPKQEMSTWCVFILIL